MKWTKRPERKTLWLAVVALTGILTAVGISFAAYTNQSHLRGTVRNSSQNVRFTSNYMQACTNNTQPANYASRTVLFGEEAKNQTALTLEIEVYNYINGSTDLVSEDDITYTMTIQVVDGSEGAVYNVTNDAGNSATQNPDGTYIFENQILKGRTPNSHKYTVTFPGSDIDKGKIIATAVPTNLSLTNNQKLAAVIALCTADSAAVFRCTGTFTDASSGGKPADYDAFNYEVAISSGQAKVTVTWDKDAVEIDPFFLEKLKKRGTSYQINGEAYEQNDSSLTFLMDQTTGAGDYLIPFYIVDRAKTKDLTWKQMVTSKIISVSGEEIKNS